MWSWFLVHLCKMIISPGVFFRSSKFWFFGLLKGQKMVQNNKKFCPSCFISQEPNIIWLSFMAHLCKMIVPVFFFIFSKFRFFWLLGGKRTRNGPKWQKILSTSLDIIRNYTSYDCHLWCTCVKWWYLQQIFSFFKILIFGVFRGIKGKKLIFVVECTTDTLPRVY